MMHAEAVFCVNFNKDSELLVTGSQDGQIKVQAHIIRFAHFDFQIIAGVAFNDRKVLA